VGFRPFVHREATRLGLSGWVRNAGAGVELEVEGPGGAVAALVERLRAAPPPGARVAEVAPAPVAPRGGSGFAIRPSDAAAAPGAEATPDLATCEDCLAELLDPADRRYRYPFVNCTACGPRYTILEALPYDRARTSMKRFAMCAACRAEYEDPSSRRFHAEPNACPACGPRLSLLSGEGRPLARDDAALRAGARAIREGAILAVKGIGGFHLLADARDPAAIARLRARKARPAKPFAVMFGDVAAVRAACDLDPAAEATLTGAARPILLLPWRAGGAAAEVAPGLPRLGVMLPYAPLHHLLLRELDGAVAATSANPGGEPILIEDDPARLAGLADLVLSHDRPILRPADDSVAQMTGGRPQLLRRARGFAPAPVGPPGLAEGVIACGGHLKAAVAVGAGCGLALSQHLGDLEGPAARAGHAAALSDLIALHGARPRLAARDLHPDYASGRAAERSGLPVVAVQHHVAHAAACLAEHGEAPPALAVAWDGAGCGPDGALWGGEALRLGRDGWRRLAGLRPFRLPGGEAAMREPRRAALGLLHAASGPQALEGADLPPLADFAAGERRMLARMLERGVNAPQTSSAGRLFDAVAALCGLCQRAAHEGQAAAALEAAAAGAPPGRPYPFPLRPPARPGEARILDWAPALAEILADLRAGRGAAEVSRRFHDGLAAAIVALARAGGERRVALTGGCFQNVRLTETAAAGLRGAGFRPLWAERVPPNDGGLAFGQAVWAFWMHGEGDGSCASRFPAGS
jgi:hydrogenase maturation protein HypF